MYSTTQLQVPGSRTNGNQHSFFPSALRLWNSIPADIINDSTTNVDSFKERIWKWQTVCRPLYIICKNTPELICRSKEEEDKYTNLEEDLYSQLFPFAFPVLHLSLSFFIFHSHSRFHLSL